LLIKNGVKGTLRIASDSAKTIIGASDDLNTISSPNTLSVFEFFWLEKGIPINTLVF